MAGYTRAVSMGSSVERNAEASLPSRTLHWAVSFPYYGIMAAHALRVQRPALWCWLEMKEPDTRYGLASGSLFLGALHTLRH